MSNEEKTALETAQDAAQAKATAENATRSGKGTRVKVSLTRGRNPQPISYENFDESLPDTLPKTLSEFMEVSKVSDEPTIVSYLLDGFNSAAYANASDATAEYVDASWPADVQRQFKLVVKNYSNATGVSIEDAVALIKPGVVASQSKK